MESKVSLAQALVPVRSKRELSSTHTRFSSLSPSFCRNKAAPPPPRSPSVSSFPHSNNKLASSSNNNKSVQSYESVERCKEAKKDRDESELHNNNNVSRSGVVESGMIFIVNDERGGGEREGPKHSLMNTTHIDYHTHRSGANKSKAQAQHEVFPGSAKIGLIALQGYTTPRDRPAKVLRLRESDLQKRSGARHYNCSRGENSKAYISSPSSNGYNNSSSPHSNQATGCS